MLRRSTFFAQSFARAAKFSQYSNPLFTEEQVRKQMEEYKRQFPGKMVEVREHPATDAGGYWIVSVTDTPNTTISKCKY